MSDSKIVLFDIPSKSGNICWSPNTWKSRALLNAKGLPYTTEWVDFPDIEPRLQPYNIAPAPNGVPGVNYTLPAIQLPEGQIVMESARIATEIERLYPSPPMHLELGLHEAAAEVLTKIGYPLFPEIAPKVRENVLTEHGKAHWINNYEKIFGPMDEAHQTKGGEIAWKAAQPGLDELAALVKNNKTDNGPFVLGSRASYADIVIVAFLKSAEGFGGDLFDGIVRGDQALKDLWAASQKWLEKDT